MIYFHGQKLGKKKKKQIPEEYQAFLKVLQSLYLWDQREREKHIISPTKKVEIGKLEANIKTPLSNLPLWSLITFPFIYSFFHSFSGH